MTKIVLCLGAGVNSTTILVLFKHGKVDLNIAIFADTSGEHPETYKYLSEVIVPFCQKIGLECVTVKSDKPPLYDFYFSRNIIPTRMFRHCTDHYKIQPINKYCKNRFGNDYTLVLGIDASEKERARSWEVFDYPLIRLGIDREKCIKIIRDEELPIPIKSGCYFCPFTKKDSWLWLLKNHRNLYLNAEKLEKNGSRYPEMTLFSIPLQRLRESKDLQKSLCDTQLFGLEKCGFCETGR